MTDSRFGWADQARLILYHVQGTSARTLFLRHATGSVIAPEPLPPLSTVLDEPGVEGELPVFLHPATLIRDYCASFILDSSLLEPQGEFHERVDTPEGALSVYLARFTCIDPPRERFAEGGGRFCAITELRGAPPAEMDLLQRAYQAIMG